MENHDNTMGDRINTAMGAERFPNLHPLALADALWPAHLQKKGGK